MTSCTNASDTQQELIFQKFKRRVRLFQGQSYKIIGLLRKGCNYGDKVQSTETSSIANTKILVEIQL